MAKAWTSISAKQVCNSMLMTAIDPVRTLSKDLAASQGVIHTKIVQALEVLKPMPSSDCSALKPFRTAKGTSLGAPTGGQDPSFTVKPMRVQGIPRQAMNTGDLSPQPMQSNQRLVPKGERCS